MLGPTSRFGSTHYARSRSREDLGPPNPLISNTVFQFLHAYNEVDSYWETPDQCTVKEKPNVMRNIDSLLGHCRQSKALKNWECDKGCCSPEVNSLAYLVKVMEY